MADTASKKLNSKKEKTVEKIGGNLIFCDCDGVLTSIADGTSFLLLDPTVYRPSKKKVDLLKKLADETGSKIVITSNWRKFDDDGYYSYHGVRFNNPFPKLRRMLKGYIYSELPPERHMTKAECMILWLEEHSEFTGNFVVFDDDPRENFAKTSDYKICKKYIETSPQTGLTAQDAEDAKKILLEGGDAPRRKYEKLGAVRLDIAKWTKD